MSEEVEELTPDEPEGFSSPEEGVEQAEQEVSRNEDPSSTIEELASSMGWREMENGKSAIEFVRDTADINQSLRKRVERLSDQVDKLVTTSTKQTMKALQEQKERLQREFDEAVESGDKQAAKRATDRMKELESEKTEDNSEVERWTPHAEKFATANQRALNDPLAKVEATQLIQSMAQQGFGPEETYQAVERKLRKEYPEFYTNQNRERPSKVSGDTPPRSEKSAWTKLLKEAPEAEGAFKSFVDMGVYKNTKEDRERYAKQALED